jgi:hypothetical protein
MALNSLREVAVDGDRLRPETCFVLSVPAKTLPIASIIFMETDQQ